MKNYKKITVTLIDGENTLEKLLTAIKNIGNTGHSFDILVDPKPDYDTNPNHGEGESFYWDGDGSDKIKDIKVEKISEDEYKGTLDEDINLDIDKGDINKFINKILKEAYSK